MTAPLAGAAARLVGRALRPAVGDPVRFTAGVAPPDPAWPAGPGPELGAGVVLHGPGVPGRPEGATVAPAPHEPGLAPAGDGPDGLPTFVPGTPPARLSPPAAVPPVQGPGPSRGGPAPSASDDVVASPNVTVAPVGARSRTLEPVGAPGWDALAGGDGGVSPEPASTLARAMAWLAQPAEPRPGDAPTKVRAGVPQPPSPPPSPSLPPTRPASAEAPPPPPTVVIDRIEIVAGPRLGPPGDPLASLADRRRGASRHAGAR